MSDKFDKKIRLQALQNLRDKNLAKNRFSSSDMNKFRPLKEVKIYQKVN